jgi:hypothetical protein
MLSALADKLYKSGGAKQTETIASAMQKIARLGMSPRQQMLNRLWAWYRCENYATRRVDWNGHEVVDALSQESISTAGFIPPGFYDAGANLPIKFRKPTAPYALVKVIVDRFTELLFSERHHPFMRVEGDSDTENYVGALIEASRLWPNMIQARQYGGAMGTVAIGFEFVEGVPEVEVHDPRWCIPDFKDRTKLILNSIEKRYMYVVEQRDEVTGEYEEIAMWYRRVIDTERDVLFKPAPVGDGNEPQWEVDKETVHGFGFCPVVWIQNLPVQDDIDGDSDVLGIYDTAESIDSLQSQANLGTISNCDPTLVVVTEDEMPEIKKGSDNAIKLSKGDAHYMELQGSGAKSAIELADKFRSQALEVAQCVLEHPDMSQRTATEIERAYSSMISKADVLREQYGEKGLKPLIMMMIKAVRLLQEGKINAEEGVIEKFEILLPPRVVDDENGETKTEPQKLGPGGVFKLQWPKYFEPLLADVELATRSAVAASAGGLVDLEHAIKFVAEYFKVGDVDAMIKRIKSEQQKASGATADQTLQMLGGGSMPGRPMPGRQTFGRPMPGRPMSSPYDSEE